ncbi:MAG: protein pelota [Candidatus Methanomethylophilaceae archaeon]|nr:protein pelota [Candidatus Methanomethylophilaceae archaeon]MDI3542096.1 protein pelota [Candidatus Methanomethylophilaceae archaeon]
MRILRNNLDAGEIRVQIESKDDLWHLFNVLEVGDLVTASTHRREEKKSDKIRAERTERKRMTLGIRVEKIEFSDFDIRLRVLGTIEEGPQDIGQHHTLNLESGEILTIRKDSWRQSQLDRLRRAESESKKPKVLFVSMDQDEALIAVLHQFGVREQAAIQSLRSGKQYQGQDESDYFGEIIDKLRQIFEEGTPLVILGPGFAKEDLLRVGRERAPEIFRHAHTFHTGQSGMAGINELMKRGLGTEVLRESRVAIEVELVERVLELIATDGAVAYGIKEVSDAAAMGAVETLLILDALLRNEDLDALIRNVEAQGGNVVVVSEQHDAGKELDAITGIAAILRYKI